VLPLSYYRTNTFLPYGVSKPKINKLSGNFVKNQPFQLSWHLFSYLRLKLGCLARKQFIFTRGLVTTFILCRINEPKFIIIHSITLLHGLQYTGSIDSLTKNNLDQLSFFALFLQPLHASEFSQNEADNS